jgi:hypothetical protein
VFDNSFKEAVDRVQEETGLTVWLGEDEGDFGYKGEGIEPAF